MLRRTTVAITLVGLILSAPVRGESVHWATKEILDFETKGVIVKNEDGQASLELQAELFKLGNLSLTPKASLNRYQVLSAMVEELRAPILEEWEMDNILMGYLDTCDL